MNRPIVLAQLGGSTALQNVRVIKLAKPGDGQAQTVYLGYDQKFKIDLSGIASEKITFVHVGERLVILFDNKSTLTIDPFFDSSGAPRNNIAFDVNGREIDGGQFASTFPITTDQSVLPAAGDGAGGAPASGGNFRDASVDPFATPNPLDLLGQEELGNFVINDIIGPESQVDIKPEGGASGLLLVDDENLPSGTSPNGPVTDTTVLEFIAGSEPLVSFVFGSTVNLSPSLTWVVSANGTVLTGSDERGPVVRLTLVAPSLIAANTDGDVTVTVELLANFDTHPGLNVDDLFNLGSVTVVATDLSGDVVTGTVRVFVSDDVPELAGNEAQVAATVLEDGLSTLTGDFSNGNRESGETDASDEATGLAGSLTALYETGADAPLTFTLSTTTSGLPVLFSHGEQLTYSVNGSVLTASTSTNVVFTLTVNANGSWSFDLRDQLDHIDNGLNDENFGLVGINGSTVPFLDFSSVIVARDSDGDRAPALPAGSFTIQVQDDVPVISETVQRVYTSTHEPITIPDAPVEGGEEGSGGSGTPIQSIIHVPDGGSILDLNVVLHLTHTFMDDLVVTLTSPDGTVIELFSNIGAGGDANGGAIVIDDEAAQNILSAGAPFNGTWRPEVDLLSLLDGNDAAGDWILTITDTGGLDVGTLISWQLEITTGSGSASQPVAIDEDDLTGPLSIGNNDVQAGDDLPVNGSPSVTGTLAFSVGADEPADITFVAMHGQQVTGTHSDNSTGQIASQGRPLYYFYDGATHTLYATWVLPADFGTGDPANNAAFGVHITNPTTGAYTFTLLDQLDHLPNGGGSEEPPTDQPSFRATLDQQQSEGGAFEDNIRLNITYTVTDDDGDEVSGTVSFDVDDDVPVQVDDAIVLGRVDEDELPDGITDGDGVTTIATGSLTSLVSVGADEEGTFSIGSTVGLPNDLTSQGGTIVYSVSGDTLTGYVDADNSGTLNAGDRSVFTLQVAANGDFTFTLLDQIDHLPNSPANDDDQTLTINFSSAIQYTDFDLDTITLDGGFAIVVEDDVPTVGENLTVRTDDETATTTDGAPNLGGTDDYDGATPPANLTGTLAHTYGADSPGSIQLLDTNPTSGLHLYVERRRHCSDHQPDAGRLACRCDACDGDGPDDRHLLGRATERDRPPDTGRERREPPAQRQLSRHRRRRRLYRRATVDRRRRRHADGCRR